MKLNTRTKKEVEMLQKKNLKTFKLLSIIPYSRFELNLNNNNKNDN